MSPQKNLKMKNCSGVFPDFGGIHTVVTVNILLLNTGTVSEMKNVLTTYQTPVSICVLQHARLG